MNQIGTAVKKPVEVDYLVWGGNAETLQGWLNRFGDKLEDHFEVDDLIADDDTLRVKTLEGTSYDVPIGYVVVRGIKGEYYPCEKSIFLQTYTVQPGVEEKELEYGD